MSEGNGKDLASLDALVARLRGPGGCPWDREQGFDEIRAYLLEEAHEVADAIDRRDWAGLSEELGDLVFQLAFLGRLSEEQGRPGLDRSVAAVIAKMIERHPHVFGDESRAGDGAASPPLDAEAVAAAWERRKLAETEQRGLAARRPRGLDAEPARLLPHDAEGGRRRLRLGIAGRGRRQGEGRAGRARARDGERAGASARGDRRPAVRRRQPGAASGRRSRSGGRPHQPQVPPPLPAHRGSPARAGTARRSGDARRDGCAVGGSEGVGAGRRR